MKTYKPALLLAFLMTFGLFSQAQARSLWEFKNPLRSEPQAPQYAVEAQESIGLQHPHSRQIAHCYSNPQTSAEQCADYFERNGYVRFRDIPYKTAKFDFLQVDTFPTRRWRDSELTSRW